MPLKQIFTIIFDVACVLDIDSYLITLGQARKFKETFGT
jgi:hypothetical protein